MVQAFIMTMIKTGTLNTRAIADGLNIIAEK